jgi:dolichyl-phosphate-mannose--protein O-mannosyl transferase
MSAGLATPDAAEPRRSTDEEPRTRRPVTAAVALAVTLVGFFTYFWGYWSPAALFWDENYHVASAQKYLHGVYFMEPHPPLGKLLIALGEAVVSPPANGDSDQFLATTYARELPEGFSFAGFRLLPALSAWLVAPLLFALFLVVTRDAPLSGLLAVPYLLDNALIVHARGAMLEPFLELFVVAMALLFVAILIRPPSERRLRWLSAGLGACFAAVLATKAIGLVMALLFPALGWRLARSRGALGAVRDLALPALAAFAVVYVGVWQAHFALAARVEPGLDNGGYFQASESYRHLLDEGRTGSLTAFPVMLRDSLAFLPHYAAGVPKLDLCRSGENGSPWFLWPVGARAINYRWETAGGEEPTYRYLYLQSNPMAWGLGLLGVALSAGLLLASVTLPLERPLRHRFLLAVFLGLWIAYLAAMSRIDRVMYLYHYFLPLLFSFILLGLSLVELRRLGRWRIDRRGRRIAMALASLAVVASFLFYSPLTYYRPITDAAFMKRSVLRLWDLRCERCPRTSPLVGVACS